MPAMTSALTKTTRSATSSQRLRRPVRHAPTIDDAEHSHDDDERECNVDTSEELSRRDVTRGNTLGGKGPIDRDPNRGHKDC